MQDLVDWTGKVCTDIEKEDAAAFAGVMKRLELNAGDALFVAGEAADSMYFLLEGTLAVNKETGFNGKSQVIALLQPFAPVGEGCLAGREKRTATVKAVENVKVLGLTKKSFQKFAAEHPAAAVRILQALLLKSSIRLEKCSERLVHVL